MMIEGTADVTRQILHELQMDGDDLSQPRDIDFSVFFNDEESCILFTESFSQTFPDAIINLDSEGQLFDLTATFNMSPAYGAIRSIEDSFNALAEKFGGFDTGWGCFATNGD